MARTDKTRPWHVRAAEHPMVSCRPQHDHRDGVCDLPADPRKNFGRGSCRWTGSDTFLYGRDRGCGCPMCTGRDFRRADRRRDRHSGRALSRSAARTARLGVGPLDIP